MGTQLSWKDVWVSSTHKNNPKLERQGQEDSWKLTGQAAAELVSWSVASYPENKVGVTEETVDINLWPTRIYVYTCTHAQMCICACTCVCAHIQQTPLV